MVKNQAFVFLKPHAVTDKAKELVKSTFEAGNFEIKKEGSIEAAEIDKRMIIDKHYYSIASKATLQKPTELNIPKDKFKDFFGMDWDDAVKAEKVFNAKDGCEKLGVDAAKLDGMWANAKKEKKLVKFGGGFYCASLPCDGDEIFVFNGFFMSMRSKFVSEGTSVYYYVVEWESSACSWEDFRGKVLGPTDPANAPKDSLRGGILAGWKDLGLASEPNVGDNGVHASASPFEAFAERMNWLGHRVERDPFGKMLLKAGLSRSVIKDWCNDPQVTFGTLPMTKSLFDSLEDTDTDYCLALCQMISSFVEGGQMKKDGPLEKEVARLKEELAKYEELAKAVQLVQDFKPAPAPKGDGKGGKGESKDGGKGKDKEKASPKGKGKGKDGDSPKGGRGKGKGKGK